MVVAVVNDLMEVLNELRGNLGAAQYTLLDAVDDGKPGDPNLVTSQSGRKFQLYRLGAEGGTSVQQCASALRWRFWVGASRDSP